MNPYVSTSIKNSIKIKKIVHYLCFELSNDYADNAEAHDFWEFVYVESGNVTMENDGAFVELKDNDILFHKPNAIHSIAAIHSEKAKMHFVSFTSSSAQMNSFCNLKMSLPYHLKKELFMLFEEANQTFERVVAHKRDYLQMAQNAPLGGGQLYKMYLEGFLIKLARFNKQGNVSKTDAKTELEYCLYQKIMDKLSANVYGELCVAQLCSELNYGKTHISGIFKKHSGMSIMYCYNMLKIAEAKKLISLKKYTLADISDMLKFNNPYYFSRTFKRLEGISPSEYKAKLN